MPRKYARVSLGGVVDRLGDLVVGDDALDGLRLLQLRVQALPRTDVVVLEVDHLHARGVPGERVLRHVVLDELALDHPVQLAPEPHRVLGEAVEGVLPAREDVADPGLLLPVAVVALREVGRLPLGAPGESSSLPRAATPTTAGRRPGSATYSPGLGRAHVCTPMTSQSRWPSPA